ncbi:GIY-YIG nuclease family protein [Streptomyces sp. NPDC057575]|uniref:GIY-YIG nuclease family protein n=1 Tax=unclassified Streptomyces TaxID=2593676 RepID=UPI0036C13AF6
MTEETAPKRTALYRLYDTAGQLLYVGISSQPKKRWSAHSRDKHWWGDVARKEVEWFETRKSAERVEKAEIQDEKPKWNRNLNGDRRWELQTKDAVGAQPSYKPREAIPEWYYRSLFE